MFKHTNKREIAFVTYSSSPCLTADDIRVASLVSQWNIEVEAVCWDAPHTDWQQFEGIVLRSCWNYHLHESEFKFWIEQMQQQNRRLFNPSQVISWNMDKNYLQVLASAGIPIPPTQWFKKGDSVHLSTLLKDNNWRQAVVKPTVSASAYQTWLTTSETAMKDQAKLDIMLNAGGVMIQSFIEEVQTKGEWSLIFFNNQFSHAVLKRTQANDFRVQHEFGGTATACTPPEPLRRQAQHIVDMIDQPLLYARVDGIEVDGTFLLMELELIEPALFLGDNVKNVAAFAGAIAAII
jgi:glutathione synthase/RimK-type ligase-like ATP-grasp enzyme